MDISADGHAVVVTDTEGTVTTWSAGAEALFGYVRGDVVGRPVDLIVPEHLRDAHWEGFRRAMAAPTVRDMAADLPVLCADGEVRTSPDACWSSATGSGSHSARSPSTRRRERPGCAPSVEPPGRAGPVPG